MVPRPRVPNMESWNSGSSPPTTLPGDGLYSTPGFSPPLSLRMSSLYRTSGEDVPCPTTCLSVVVPSFPLGKDGVSGLRGTFRMD